MEVIYTHKMKQKLADRISKLKKKEQFVAVYEIIHEDNNKVTENQNGLFLLFDKLDNSTYYKIDIYLQSLTKSKYQDTHQLKKYSSYVLDEFPDQEKLNSKLKYSNTEKNIIKRQRYNKNALSESQCNDSDVVYTDFDVNASITTESSQGETSLSEQYSTKSSNI